ncbi:hypothetical protein I6F43_02500 [Pseudoalteromonas sp. NZS71_1]|uniref:hypothetical protein n=1 Tax=unclassified Pseudoalteromonas TaxID=194690 RepID=UPI0013FD1994|nr:MULTISPECIES: hypothetical protein [unclassified Pseudoalteromonas]MBG9990747.1 hypothetical protein [Pseudoalteromonas sp. NZS37]MBH0033571.1 hypothetical protein [Pseudoalteromonas sp. NZS71_1]
MGEWSDYFEDLPEEALQPPIAAERAKEKFDSDIKDMNADAFALIAKTRKKAIDALQMQKKQFFESVDYCPQCGEKELNVYKLENKTYLCECQNCGICGSGDNFPQHCIKQRQQSGIISIGESVHYFQSAQNKTNNTP